MSFVKTFLKKMLFAGGLLAAVKKLIDKKPTIIIGNQNKITNNGIFKNVSFDIIGNNNTILIGKNTIVSNTLIFIRGDHHRIIIGENCFMGKGELWIEDDHCSLVIHSFTTIEHAHLAVTEPFSVIEIYNDCMLSNQIEIRTGDSHSIIDMQTGKRINHAANVTLQEHVWVGAHAKILKGVTIGNNTVIATGAVVTGDIPPHSIAAGIPAKVIKTSTDWKRERNID